MKHSEGLGILIGTRGNHSILQQPMDSINRSEDLAEHFSGCDDDELEIFDSLLTEDATDEKLRIQKVLKTKREGKCMKLMTCLSCCTCTF